jgi:putative glutamine amidotransferase
VAAPLIGLTTSRSVNEAGIVILSTTEAYVQAILRAGGFPVLIPTGVDKNQALEICSHLQGLLFTGGGDLDPDLFGGVHHPRVYGIEPLRDDLEISLVQFAAREGFPFFGICRGIQVINVALGGTLFTNLSDQHPGEIRHDMFPGFPYHKITHPVEIVPGSLLDQIVGQSSLPVNSLHHQGISATAKALQLAAYSPDGLVEAVFLADHPFGLGVQWHPEWLQDDPQMQAIFRKFVETAGNRA